MYFNKANLDIKNLSYFKEYLKVNDDTVLCDGVAYHCSIKDIKYKKLIKVIANQDFIWGALLA